MYLQVLSDLATGHTWSGGDGPYTLAPLVGSILTVLMIRSIVGQRIGIATLAVSVVLGALFATISGTCGYTLTIAAWLRRTAPTRRLFFDMEWLLNSIAGLLPAGEQTRCIQCCFKQIFKSKQCKYLFIKMNTT